jgi:hypothetical protein
VTRNGRKRIRITKNSHILVLLRMKIAKEENQIQESINVMIKRRKKKMTDGDVEVLNVNTEADDKFACRYIYFE